MGNHSVYTARRGELDLRGYEIVRVQFFNFVATRSVTFSKGGISFSSECIRSLGGVEHIKILIHPTKKSLVVKPCTREDKQMMRWTAVRNGRGYSRKISAAAYIKTLYELFGWAPEYRYRFRGFTRGSDGDRVLEFDLCEPETITSEQTLYPDDWNSNFGTDYYHFTSLYRDADEQRKTASTQYLYNTEPNIHPTPPQVLSTNINSIITTLTNPEADNGAETDS